MIEEEYLLSEYDFAQYVYKLLDCKLFAANKEYIRRQILYCLLQVRMKQTQRMSTGCADWCN